MEIKDECPLCHNKLTGEDVENAIRQESMSGIGGIDLENIDEKKKLHHESMKTGRCAICGQDIFAAFSDFEGKNRAEKSSS